MLYKSFHPLQSASQQSIQLFWQLREICGCFSDDFKSPGKPRPRQLNQVGKHQCEFVRENNVVAPLGLSDVLKLKRFSHTGRN